MPLIVMQYFVHAPSSFIYTYSKQLLPSWSNPISSVLIVLQRCQFEMLDRTPATVQGKDQLRQQFLDLGNRIALQLKEMNYLSDVFDPKTGFPTLSPPGQLQLDDVAVVRTILGFETITSGGCAIALHPTWKEAVYPAILVSSAHPAVLKQAVEIVRTKPVSGVVF
jgi:hypothetical protein